MRRSPVSKRTHHWLLSIAAGLTVAALALPALSSASAATSPATAVARTLLNEAILPSTAELVHPSTAVVCQCAGTPGTEGLVTLHRYYVVMGPPTAVESFLTTHLPKGAHYDGSTGTSSSSNGNGIISITFTFRANGPHSYLKQLAYSMTKRNASTSWLRIDSQVVWIPARTSNQIIKGAVSATVTGYKSAGLMGSSGDVRLSVSGKRLVTLMREFNSLPLGPQNGCMETLNGFTIAITLKDGAHLQVFNGYCAGSYDTVSEQAGNSHETRFVLSVDSCTFAKYVVSLFVSKSVPGTSEALKSCETWAKANT